jgi:hypothetical protein
MSWRRLLAFGFRRVVCCIVRVRFVLVQLYVVGPPTAEENTGTAEKELIACLRRKN